MAAPAEVSKNRSNFRLRQFYEKRLFTIAANLPFNTMISFVILLNVCTARIACADRHIHIDRHTHTHKTTNPRCDARRGLIIRPDDDSRAQIEHA